MRISMNWLKQYVDLDVSPDDLSCRLTMLGLEIESVERPGAEVSGVRIGRILSIDPHPDADRLVVCKTDVGESEPLQIVCGATNMKAGDLVPTATVGATLPGGFSITRRKMRGIESQGMMCSARELGLGQNHEGLLILEAGLPVGDDAVKVLGLDDVIFEIEVTPNRGDWASMIGVARELAAWYGTALRVPSDTISEAAVAAASMSSITIEAPDLCPRYCGRIITGVTIGPSPRWLAQRLIAAGVRPINNVVDVTNYVLMETGQPLHAFDFAALAEKRIVVRRAKQSETIATIDETVRTLADTMLVIADAERAVALAGIMGGHDSEVTETTTDVFLESAYFDPICIRRTARALGMVTEASQRFQRGVDPAMAEYAANRAAQLIQELAGGEVASGLLDEYPRPVERPQVELRYARANALLGAEIAPQQQREFLSRLGFTIVASTDDGFRVQVPTWRHDVGREADLIEEVARLYGYDRIATTIPHARYNSMTFAPEAGTVRLLRRHLASQGLTEMMDMTFSSPAAIARAELPQEYRDMVLLQNPLSENHAGMRTSLIPGLIASAAKNHNRGVASIAAYEIGPAYRPNPQGELPDQRTHLGVVLSGERGMKHWSEPQAQYDFYDLKGYAEAVLEFFGAHGTFQAVDFSTFAAGQAAAIVANGDVVGYLGTVSKPVLDAHDIAQPVYLLEINLDPLLERPAPVAAFAAPPSFPPSLRDIAVLVDATLPAGDLCTAARDAGGRLLQSVGVFDVYKGKQVPPGKKSVALSLVFQSNERTLTDKDTQKAWDSILKRLETDFGAQLR